MSGPAYYDIDEYTDQTTREIVEETIREKALKILSEEVPHRNICGSRKNEFKKNNKTARIFMTSKV